MKKQLLDKEVRILKNYVEYGNRKLNNSYRFIFLCGRGTNVGEDFEETNRGIVKNFFIKTKCNIITVLSEKLYEENNDLDLLSFEELLFELCDYLILFVESPGTFCELGAFSINKEEEFKKLIVINDINHINDNSFVNKGPLKKIQDLGGKVIYSKLDKGDLLFNNDVLKVLNNIKEESNKKTFKTINKNFENVNINSFIFEILEIIKVLQPLDYDSLLDIYKKIKGFKNFVFKKKNGESFIKEVKVSHIINLMVKADLIINDNGLLRIRNNSSVESLMLNMDNNMLNKLRNKFLCNRYKNGESPCIKV